MALITARGLGMRFGPHDIFENISIAIHHGERAALVGPNGQGKTTLLRLLVGEETPTAGQVFRAKDLRIGYLRQESARVTGDETLWQLADGAFEHLKAQADELAALEKQLADDPSLLERYGQLQEAFERAGGYHYPVTIERVLTGLGFDRVFDSVGQVYPRTLDFDALSVGAGRVIKCVVSVLSEFKRSGVEQCQVGCSR